MGNGTRINVWRDKWIPRPSSYKVITPMRPNVENALVCELINRASGEWDVDKLNSWFQLEDREVILSIPLSTNGTNDRLVWAENRSNKFIVKSAYLLALKEQQRLAMGDCLNSLNHKKIWKALWNLNVPQKIKHFAWRASRDILATKMNLAKRKIASSGTCELCGKEEETICHLLWFCEHAKGVWMTSKLVFPFEISLRWSFLDVVENCLRWEDTSPGLLEEIITVCWGIWKDRNVLRLGGKGQASHTILSSALHLLDEFRAANELKSGIWAEAPPMVVWQPPSHGHYKVNTDGAVFSNRKQADIGVIIRDDSGEVVAALSKKWNVP